jgi:hypothetical protein
MLTFSKDPKVAEEEMQAIIFYLTAFGYIDGDFDTSEKTFIKDYIRKLVEGRAQTAMADATIAQRNEVVDRFVRHFHEVFEEIDRSIRGYFDEVVGPGETVKSFVYAKLKLRSYEIFKSFAPDNQAQLLATVDELISADGKIHPSEEKFRAEVRALLDSSAPMPGVSGLAVQLQIDRVADRAAPVGDHPFFASEDHYSKDPVRIRRQISGDYELIRATRAKLDEQREKGQGQLAGVRSFKELEGRKPFLDGHVYYHPEEPGKEYELTVLGDLHGCYSCLKAAVLQSNFFARVEAYRLDPKHNPCPKLVLLGDYIDRGRFSYNGVLRTVMQLFLAEPEHVYPLRGNHEYYIEYNGRIYGGVQPAEAINTLVGFMPKEMFEAYMQLFESLPNMLVFGKTLFVHAGIPRDRTFKAKFKDLSSLNEPELRFEMMWSDPSQADYIPEDLQAENARFPFGRLQFFRFMELLGLDILVRGHEKIEAGFKAVYPPGGPQLLNLFSAGGDTNDDLPPDSSYRDVMPMALTMRIGKGTTQVTPWRIDYERWNDPELNRFFASPPEIEHRT